MTNSKRLSLSFLGAVSTVLLAQAQPAPLPPPMDPSGSGHKSERRINVRSGPAEFEKENVTFLGVETFPVSPTLTAQLNLPKGAGLVVSHIVPESPAASALQTHDVLLKMDDQLLIESRQFSVLIRNHQEGDQVTLTYVRAGKQATATVKLTKHEVPKMAFFEREVGPGDTMFFGPHGAMHETGRQEMDHVLSLVGPGSTGGQVRHVPPGTPGNLGFRSTAVNPGNSSLLFSDEQGSLNLTIKDGHKTLVAKNPKGEEVFSGPVTTPEERKALPPQLRERLDRLEGMQEFSFETDGDFHDHLKMLSTERSKISLPKVRFLRRSAPQAAF